MIISSAHNDEFRITNDERTSFLSHSSYRRGIRHSKFDILSSFVIRNSSLVLGHSAIDLVGPGEDAAFQVFRFVESLLPKKLHRLGAAHAALAVDHHVHVLIQFGEALGKFGERNQDAAWNPA